MKYLRLNIFEDCHLIVKEKLKKLKAQLKTLDQIYNIKFLEQIKLKIKSISGEILFLERKKQHLTNNLNEINDLFKIFPQTSLIKYNELFEYNLTNEESILQSTKEIKSKLNNKINLNLENVKEKLKNSKEILLTLENENQDIKYLTEQKEQLIRKFINVPKKFNKIDVNKIKTESEVFQNRIIVIDKILNDKNNKILNKKMDRILKLKNMISILREFLKPVGSDPETKLTQFKTDLLENQKLILSFITAGFKTPIYLNDIEKDKLLEMKTAKTEFLKYINDIIKKINKYEPGYSETNDNIIHNVKKKNKIQSDKYNKWLLCATQKINNTETEPIDVDNIFNTSHHLTKQIIEKYIDMLQLHDNNIILNKIKIIETELDSLSEFKCTKQEIDNLEQEKNILKEKIELFKNKIKDDEEYDKKINSNIKTQTELDILQTEIDEQLNIQLIKSGEIKKIKNKILNYESLINNHSERIEENKKIKYHFKLIKEYHLLYLNGTKKEITIINGLLLKMD